MRNSRLLALFCMLFVATACADLEVENLNDPDRERALATPGDVETLISGTFWTWYRVEARIGDGPVAAASVMADQHTSSWGNQMMRDASSEPRTWVLQNDPSYGYSYAVEDPWFFSYRILASLRDGLIAVDAGLQIGDGGADTPRARAFARFMQGLAHGTLALLYDEAFVLDENTDLEANVRVPYGDVRDAAIGYLNEAISIASANQFSIPGGWLANTVGGVDSDGLVRLAHSFIARYMAYTPRTVAERDAVDWSAVLSHVNQGITQDWALTMDDEVWWNDYTWMSQAFGWGRIDLRMLGPADQKGPGAAAGSWVDWEQETPGLRTPFPIDADDLRLPVYPPQMVEDDFDCEGLPREPRCGAPGLRMVMEYRDPMQPFRPERGLYHFSGYGAYPDVDYFKTWDTPVLAMMKFEMDMLAAEAYIRLGQEASAWPLIDATRVTYGGLTSVNGLGAADPVPEDAPGRCTPRMISPFPNGTWQCGNLFEAMKYEKRMETYATGMGIPWFDDRGWGDLISGTITMFPVPAQELLTLLEEVYSFGGSPGTIGSAPDIVAWEGGGLRPLQPGDVPTDADIQARVALFQRIDDAAGRSAHPTKVRRE